MAFYNDSHSILVINREGRLKQVFTPFKVKCIEDHGRLKNNSIVFVEEVLANWDNSIFYKIGNNFYIYRNFLIDAFF